MTADPLARGLPVSTALDMCDRLLGEAGRRRHVFAWLRESGSAAEEWLPVDAYYPRARLVVMCRPTLDPHDGLFRELIPAHGLGLLRLDTDALGEDAAVVEAALAAKIFDLEHVPRPRNPPPSPLGQRPTTRPRRPGRRSRSSGPPLSPPSSRALGCWWGWGWPWS